MAVPLKNRELPARLRLKATADRTRTRQQKNSSSKDELRQTDHKSDPPRGKSHKSDDKICDPDTRNITLPDTFSRPSPTELPAAKLKAIEGLRRHGVIAEACRASGIGRRAFYQLLKEDPDFKSQVKDARNECLDELERCMWERAKYPRGDLAGIFILKHSRRKFHEVQRVELTGKDGAPVAYVDAKEELLRRIAAAQSRGAIDVEAVAAGSGGSRGPALVAGSQSEQVKASVRKTGSQGKLRDSRR